MYCASCGKTLEPGVRFCPSCGAAVSPASTPPGAAGTAPPPPYGASAGSGRSAQLLRPREGRVIAGVCAAFALRFGWDVMLVRILLSVLTLLTGVAVGVMAYLIAWLVIPDAPFALSQPGR